MARYPLQHVVGVDTHHANAFAQARSCRAVWVRPTAGPLPMPNFNTLIQILGCRQCLLHGLCASIRPACPASHHFHTYHSRLAQSSCTCQAMAPELDETLDPSTLYQPSHKPYLASFHLLALCSFPPWHFCNCLANLEAGQLATIATPCHFSPDLLALAHPQSRHHSSKVLSCLVPHLLFSCSGC